MTPLSLWPYCEITGDIGVSNRKEGGRDECSVCRLRLSEGVDRAATLGSGRARTVLQPKCRRCQGTRRGLHVGPARQIPLETQTTVSRSIGEAVHLLRKVSDEI